MFKMPTITLYARCQLFYHSVTTLHVSQFVSDTNSSFTYGLYSLMRFYLFTTMTIFNPKEEI